MFSSLYIIYVKFIYFYHRLIQRIVHIYVMMMVDGPFKITKKENVNSYSTQFNITMHKWKDNEWITWKMLITNKKTDNFFKCGEILSADRKFFSNGISIMLTAMGNAVTYITHRNVTDNLMLRSSLRVYGYELRVIFTAVFWLQREKRKKYVHKKFRNSELLLYVWQLKFNIEYILYT